MESSMTTLPNGHDSEPVSDIVDIPPPPPPPLVLQGAEGDFTWSTWKGDSAHQQWLQGKCRDAGVVCPSLQQVEQLDKSPQRCEDAWLTYSWTTNDHGKVSVSLPLSLKVSSTGAGQLDVQLRLVELEWVENGDTDNGAASSPSPSLSLPFARHASTVFRTLQTTAFVGLAKLLLPDQHRIAWRYVATLGLLEPAACAVGWAARAAAGQLQSNWGLRSTWMMVYSRTVDTQHLSPAQQIASHGFKMLSQAARETAMQLLIPTLAIATSQLLWEFLHPASFQIATSMLALCAVSADYKQLTKACSSGKIAPGRDTEAAWRTCHKRSAQRLAPLQTDLSPQAPLAPLFSFIDGMSIAAAVVVDGIPFYGGLDTSTSTPFSPTLLSATQQFLPTHSSAPLSISAPTLQPYNAHCPQLCISASIKLPTSTQSACTDPQPTTSVHQALAHQTRTVASDASSSVRLPASNTSSSHRQAELPTEGSMTSDSSSTDRGFSTDSSACSHLADGENHDLSNQQSSVESRARHRASTTPHNATVATSTATCNATGTAGTASHDAAVASSSRSIIASPTSQVPKSGRRVINVSAIARSGQVAARYTRNTADPSTSTPHRADAAHHHSTQHGLQPQRQPAHAVSSRALQDLIQSSVNAQHHTMQSGDARSPLAAVSASNSKALVVPSCPSSLRRPQAGVISRIMAGLSWTKAGRQVACPEDGEEVLMLYGVRDHAVAEATLSVWDIVPLTLRALYLAAIFMPFLSIGLLLLLIAWLWQRYSTPQQQYDGPRQMASSAALSASSKAVAVVADSDRNIGRSRERSQVRDVAGAGHQQREYQGHSDQGHNYQDFNHQHHNRPGHNHQGHNHQGHNHQGHNYQGHNHQGHNHQGHNHQGHNHQGQNHQDHIRSPRSLNNRNRRHQSQLTSADHFRSQQSPASSHAHPTRPQQSHQEQDIQHGHPGEMNMDGHGPCVPGKPAWLRMREASWQLLVAGCRLSGAAFIKWAQWASTRGDLFPDDFCVALSQLQDAAPTHCMAHTRRSVEKAFGKKLSELFVSFEEEPLASGSIAQVHKAVLLLNGEPVDVVVKVVHPSAARSIRMDFQLLKPLAGVVGSIRSLRGLHLKETISQFSHTMTAQVDMRVEAAHLQRFRRNFQALHGSVVFPEPIMHWVAKDVLVETFEVGRSVRDFMKRPGPFNTQIVAKGVDTYLKMLLQDNFIHTDLHPGNIMVRPADGFMRPRRRNTNKTNRPPVGASSKTPGSRQTTKHFTAPGGGPAALRVTSSTRGGTAGVEGQAGCQTKDEVQGAEEEEDLFAHLWRFQEGRAVGPPPPAQLVLLDCGLAQQLTLDVRVHFVSLLNHISAGDGAAAARHVLKWSHPQTCPNPRSFRQAMVALFDRSCDIQSSQGIDLDAVMKSIMMLVQEHEVAVDSCYATLVISVCVLLGFATSLDPHVNLMDAATPALLAYNLTGRVMGRLYQ